MANIMGQFPSKYLRADDLPDEGKVFVMSGVEMETVGQGSDADVKPVLYFYEEKKGVVLNKTNATTISGLYGSETDDWDGKAVTLYPTETNDPSGKLVPCIRVRNKVPKAAGAAAKAAPGDARAAMAKAAPAAVNEDAEGEDIPF